MNNTKIEWVDITVQCDRCGKIVHGKYIPQWYPHYTSGYHVVSEGYFEYYKRWEENNVCRECMVKDPKYISTNISCSFYISASVT